MRSVTRTICLIAAICSCHPAPKSVAASTSAADTVPSTGKIPISAHSRAAIELYQRARALNENLQPHEAYALFEKAVALDSSFAMGEYGLAATAPTAKQVREHLTKAVALSRNVSNGERLLILAMQARVDADPISVRQYAESLVTHYPRDERAHWVLGSAWSAQQSYEKAIEQYQRAIDINPQYSLAYNAIGYAYRPTGNTAAAEKAFRQYIALVPNDPNPYDSYAELLMKVGRFDESIAQYRKALSIDPHFSGSLVGIAANHMFAGRHQAAIAESERYLSVARDDHERRAALLTEALIDVDNGATDDALRAMDKEYELARAIGDTLSMSSDAMAVGDILLDAGRIDAASERYRQAHELVVASSLTANLKQDCELITRYNAARVALAKHDLPTARSEAIAFTHGAEARRNGDRIRQAHELNGLIYLNDKEFDRSLAELALADQQNAAVLYQMAAAYHGQGNHAKGDELMASAIHMYTLPTFPYMFVRAKAKALAGQRTSSK